MPETIDCEAQLLLAQRTKFEKWAVKEFHGTLPLDWDEDKKEYSIEHPAVEGLWRAFKAGNANGCQDSMNRIRTGRTMTNFNHVPEVMRALDWFVEEIREVKNSWS